MPMAGPSNSPELLARTNKEPMSGPVQLKDTKASVKAIKKMPIKPPRCDKLSDPSTHLLGKVIQRRQRS